MRKMVIILATALLLVPALAALAQEMPGNVARVIVMQPKPGMTQQFEEGRKRHMDWHRKQNDTWAWETWQVETGDASGSYLSVASGHAWKDFDDWEAKLGKADTEDATKNISPNVAAELSSLWVYLPNISRPAESKAPPKMMSVIHFLVKPEAESGWRNAVRKIHEAIGKTDWPTHYMWYALVNGGETPHYVLLLPRNSYAEMAPPEVSFEAMLEKAMGREDAQALQRTISNSIRREWSELITYRADLSYRPAAK